MSRMLEQAGVKAMYATTFLDVVAFLGRLVSDGVDAAVEERTQNLSDLVWGRQGEVFELAIEAAIPEDRRRIDSHADEHEEQAHQQAAEWLDHRFDLVPEFRLGQQQPGHEHAGAQQVPVEVPVQGGDEVQLVGSGLRLSVDNSEKLKECSLCP